MTKVKRLVVVFVGYLLMLGGAVVQAQWTRIAPGISYREYTLDGPIRVYVARADRSKTNWVFDTMLAQGSLRQGLETVPDMARRYDDSVNFAGQRYDVKVAINGSYFAWKTSAPLGGQIIGGWYVYRFGEYSGGTGFIWKFNRDFVLCGNVRNWPKLQHVVFEDKAELAIDKLNQPRGTDELVVYTCHYDDRTYTTADGVEVVVHLEGPLRVLPTSAQNVGTILEVRRGAGSTPLHFDDVVISAQGKAAAELSKHARVGQKVRFDLRLKDYGNKDLGLRSSDWRGAYAGMSGHCYCLVDGVVHKEHWEARARAKIAAGGKSGAIVQDPRTILAANDDYIFFVVVDGRSKASKGMTFTQCGEFCRDVLKATDAITQDGGGSSTMWVDAPVEHGDEHVPGYLRHTGRVVNVPSDGHPRAVANGFCLALVYDPEKSTTFRPNDRVKTKGVTADLRLGPGTHYESLVTLPRGQIGTVLRHTMNGIRAKGTHWWWCRFGGVEGWVSEKELAAGR